MGARCIWGAEERFKSDVFDCVIQAVLVMRPLEPDFSSPTCYTVLSAVHAVNGQEFRGRLLSLLWRCLVDCAVVAERLNAADLKSVNRETGSRVQIPPTVLVPVRFRLGG